MLPLLLDPNVAYLLLVGGFILAILALFSPGTGILEIGALAVLLLAGYSIYNLPINFWALAILVVGVIPFLLALRRTRQWIYLAASLLALSLGSIFLFRSTTGVLAVYPLLAITVSLIATVGIWWMVQRGLEAMALAPEMSMDRLLGMVGEARTDVFREGTVYVDGEEWTAQSRDFIPHAGRVKVIGRRGLVLEVEPYDKPA